MSNFQRRLVHQTIRNEFPDLRTFGHGNLLGIKQKEAHREAEAKERDERMLVQSHYKQYGVCFITDALAGREWHKKIDTGVVGRRIEGERQTDTTALFKSRLRELDDSLKAHRPVMVGHNCFLDLVYIYHNFYGALPDTVEGFQEKLNEVFPLIVDTKYLSTVDRGPESRAMQLAQLSHNLSSLEKPVIRVSLS